MESLLLVKREGVRKVAICPLEGESVADRFAATFSTTSRDGENVCAIDFVAANLLESDLYNKLENQVIFGCLGMVRIFNDDFICIITAISHVGTLLGKKLYRIDKVIFVSTTSGSTNSSTISLDTAAAEKRHMENIQTKVR